MVTLSTCSYVAIPQTLDSWQCPMIIGTLGEKGPRAKFHLLATKLKNRQNKNTLTRGCQMCMAVSFRMRSG